MFNTGNKTSEEAEKEKKNQTFPSKVGSFFLFFLKDSEAQIKGLSSFWGG